MLKLELEKLCCLAIEITQSVIAKNAELVDKECHWPETGFRALLDAGLGGLVVPVAYGGHGQGLSALSKICEIIGHACPSTAICFGMHSVGASVIAANPNDYQIETFLKPIVDGKHITTLSLSEPGNGAHFYLPETTLHPGNPHSFIINGKKSFVTNGGHADSYVISGVNSHDELEEMSCMILPANTPGMSWEQKWQGLGMRGNSSQTLNLNNVEVSSQCLLGKEGDQIWYIFNIVAPWFLTAMAGTYLGIAKEAFNIGLAHIKKREHTHNGRSLASNSLIQHRLAELWSELRKTDQLVTHSANLFDSGDSSALPLVLSSKADVAELVVRIVNEIMTLMGGMGYRDNDKLGRFLRDARAAHVMSPTTNLLRLWVGRILLEQPILSDD